MLFKIILKPLEIIRKFISIVRSGNYLFLLFALPGHFYSPIPDINEIRMNSKIIFDITNKELPGIFLNEDEQLSLASNFIKFYGDIPFPEKKLTGFRYYFDNDFFSYGDGVSLYSLMRILEPKRIIEIGSGFSSAAMLDVDEKIFGEQIDFTFIEPYTDRLLSLINNKDIERVTILKERVQNISEEIFANLCTNDILFIDSSHVAKIDSDVLHILFKILPILKQGVVIHFHDILWPFEYPKIWLGNGRAWNEAYILRSFLQYNVSFKIMYFNSFIEAHHAKFLKNNMPLMLKKPSSAVTFPNTSLWITKAL